MSGTGDYGAFGANREPLFLLCGVGADVSGTAAKFTSLELVIPATNRIEVVFFQSRSTSDDIRIGVRSATIQDSSTAVDFSGSTFSRTGVGTSAVVAQTGVHTAEQPGNEGYVVATGNARGALRRTLVPGAAGTVLAFQTVSLAGDLAVDLWFAEYSV